MALEMCSLKAELEEKDKEISALKKKLAQLEKKVKFVKLNRFLTMRFLKLTFKNTKLQFRTLQKILCFKLTIIGFTQLFLYVSLELNAFLTLI